MHMHLATLQILEKRFPPEDARAIAQAIEAETGPERLVTNESLKLQLGEIKLQLVELENRLNLKMADLETRLSNKMIGYGVTGTGIIITAVFFMVLNLKR